MNTKSNGHDEKFNNLNDLNFDNNRQHFIDFNEVLNNFKGHSGNSDNIDKIRVISLTFLAASA